jgi:RHS repeat-associated protein
MTAGGEKQDRQPYKYGNKELDEMNGLNLYDFLARGYDPAIGRFMAIDPLAEKYYSISPYAYCGNNPVNRVDPTGMDWAEDENGNVEWRREYTKDDVPKGYKYIGTEYMGITVLDYRVTDYVDKNYQGITIKLGYNKQDGKDVEDGDYQWVQTINTDYPQHRLVKSPYVDPTPSDDDLPYYHKEGDSPFLNKDGYDVTFSDKPNKYGTDFYWGAELSLVENSGTPKKGDTTPNHYDPVVSLDYGFESKNNAITLYPLRIANPPSGFHMRSINQKVSHPTLIPVRRK